MPFTKCPNCGKLNSVKHKNCPKCGVFLDAAASASPRVTVAPTTPAVATPEPAVMAMPSSFDVAAAVPTPAPSPFGSRQQGSGYQGTQMSESRNDRPARTNTFGGQSSQGPANQTQQPAVDPKPRPKFCPECGSPLSGAALFCGNCGHRVIAEPSGPVAATPVPPQKKNPYFNN